MENITYLSVSEFTKSIKNNLENSYPLVYLRGEISNFRKASSGHWYFVLKDEQASIRAIIFKNAHDGIYKALNTGNRSCLENGQEILAEGRISLYERSGEYSIIISKIIPVGIGELTVKFEILKEKLAKKGFFDPAHKRQLPHFPEHIGIITSPTAAALQDILNVLNRRFTSVRITVFPAGVQGENAKYEIVKAIQCANYHYIHQTKYKTNVLILARGGGSLEDLWPFNEEIVAEAVYQSQVPIITGIGHEIDFTIADFCADLRAPTPSAAAEIVVKNSTDLINTITALTLRMTGTVNNLLEKLNYRIEKGSIPRLKLLFEKKYQSSLQDYSFLKDRMLNTFNEYYQKIRQNFQIAVQKLDNLSPLKTLNRGYSLILDQNHQLVTAADQIAVGDPLNVIFCKGEIEVKVEKIMPEKQIGSHQQENPI